MQIFNLIHANLASQILALLTIHTSMLSKLRITFSCTFSAQHDGGPVRHGPGRARRGLRLGRGERRLRPGRQFNRNVFGLSFSSSFGLRFPKLMKSSKMGILQSGTAYHSQGFEDKNLGSSPGLLGQ